MASRPGSSGTPHYATTVAWRTFQHSLGFTPLIGLLSSNASNRCAKLAASGAPRLGDNQGGAVVVDVVSVTFGVDDASSPERRSAFEERWNSLVAPATIEHGILRHTYSVWLENNASTFFQPTVEEAAAATNSATFIAFLAWDGAYYGSHRAEELCGNLQASFQSFHGIRPIISKKTVELIGQVQRERHHLPRQPAAPPLSLASIRRMDIPRRCSADLIGLRENARQALDRSINDARARTRLFPAPRCSFISQGELYEDNMPVVPEWRITRGPFQGCHLVDIVWIHLKPHTSRSRSIHIYNQLRNKIAVLPGFVKGFWACDVEHNAKIAVLTVWEDQHARTTALLEYRWIWDNFARSSAHLAAPLTSQVFPMVCAPFGLQLDTVEYIEVTCFHVPPGLLERQLFESAYAAFIRMTEPSPVAGIATACRGMDAGGWQPADATESLDSQLFTGVLVWASPAARIEWYEELFRLSRESYELFGHKLDALRLLTEDITARFLKLQR
ncbi:hypothetical protein O1611_g2883 [Lasiodiplodia mahajangana]|uniref:Uncharacterized protein n=1 Tax=Lasiodiplodia mahajangana TaxID=1108764 RepID=A0ACC2JTL0_9PEZI|nr:hypothetical protein O1611_g2883 [Lasiodiplodia mahajangana]